MTETLLPLCLTALQSGVFDDIEQFANALEALTEAHGSENLEQFVSVLKSAIERYDIGAIEAELNRFVRIFTPQSEESP